MSKSLTIISFTISVFVGLLVLIAIVLLFFLDINAYKPRFEATISDTLGMKVNIDGRLEIGLFPNLFVTLKDVHIRNRGTEVANAREARVGIDVFPLFQKEVRIKKIVVEHPSISIEKARDGKYNFEKSEEAEGPLPNLILAKVSFSNGTLRYVGKQSGDGFEAGDCNLDMSRLQLSVKEHPGIMRNLSFAAELACGEVRTKDYTASDLKLSVTGQRGVFELKPLTMRVFAGQGSGSMRADFTGAVPLYDVRYSLSQFRIEEFLKNLSTQKTAEGPMDFSADLSLQGETVNKLRRSMRGRITLRGKNLILYGRDLDQEFARFESSQTFNLVDLGALFFAGPVGLTVTKGYNFASILQGSEGRSEIRTLVSDWKVEGGAAQSQDVAMATDKNRVALQGGLDFVSERFDAVTVALIDSQGCIRAQQTIHGAFKEPVVEKPSTLKSLTGPVVKLLKQVGRLFPGGECEVFYAGSVESPN
ncbi:MAG: AsmA family protein [Proteobacteria bacterium]|nr:MAG: AsmA family protein [Pseudomonadota bacterium]QKK12174.1 MAG: AsmA family protein [Pseudomonadota bacterium]